MPEGPSIVIAKEAMQLFAGQKVIAVTGNTTFDKEKMDGQKILSIKSWGKHLLLCFKDFTVRIHFLMFGSYSVNEKKENRVIRLGLRFKKGELNFYTCSVKFLEEDVDTLYDWTADVMNDDWDAKAAKKKLKNVPEMMICDALLEQDIFSGVGNIIKNEVLYKVKVQPESLIGKIPTPIISKLIKEVRIYSFQFLEWKKKFILKKQWLSHTKKMCLRCDFPFIKKNTGKNKRRSFFCTKCQSLLN